ncbi:MAG TPA: HAD hydrolase-like protein [Candidatus Sulfotelmatobacter sp.]
MPHLEPLPGANQLLRHLSRHGIRFAIASTGSREQTSLRWKRLALPAGTPIVTGDDVEKAKPSPRSLRGGRRQIVPESQFTTASWSATAYGTCSLPFGGALGVGFCREGTGRRYWNALAHFVSMLMPPDLLMPIEPLGLPGE